MSDITEDMSKFQRSKSESGATSRDWSNLIDVVIEREKI